MAHFTWTINPISEKDDEINIDESFPGSDDNSFRGDEDPPLPSEYLLDVYDVMRLYKTVLENRFELANISSDFSSNKKMRNYIEYSRAFLEELDSFRGEELENSELANIVTICIEEIRNRLNLDYEFDIFSDDLFPVLIESRVDETQFRRLNAIYNNIGKLVGDYRSEQSEDKRDSTRHKLYYHLDKLAEECSGQARRRREFVRRCSYYLRYSTYKNGHLTSQMILDNAEFYDYLDKVENSIAYSCSKTFSDFLNNDSASGFGNVIDSFDGIINSSENGGHIFGDHNRKKKGCFAALQTPASLYISLSGPFDATEKIRNYMNFEESKIQSNESLRDKIVTYILSDPLFSNAIYSEMSFPMLRYFYNNERSNPIKCLYGPEALWKAINVGDAPANVMSSYSCCERKMFAKLNATIIGDSYLFTRHEPCYKCKPAIKDLIVNNPRMNLRIFHYDTNGSPCEFDKSRL